MEKKRKSAVANKEQMTMEYRSLVVDGSHDECCDCSKEEHLPRRGLLLLKSAWSQLAALSASVLLLVFATFQIIRLTEQSPFTVKDLSLFLLETPMDLIQENSTIESLPQSPALPASTIEPLATDLIQENSTSESLPPSPALPASTIEPLATASISSLRGNPPSASVENLAAALPSCPPGSRATDGCRGRVSSSDAPRREAARLLPWHSRDWSAERGTADDARRIAGTKVGSRGRISAKDLRKKLQCLSRNGSWVYSPRPRKLPWNNWGGMNHPNSCDEAGGGIWGAAADDVAVRGGDWSVRVGLKYKWITSPCKFRFFTVEGFCRAVGPGNNILMVGDSMTSQFYDSMRNYLLSTPEKRKNSGFFNCSATACHRVCEDVLGKGQGFDIDWIRTDYLNLTDTDITWGVHQNKRWVQYIDELKAKVIILNRGAHYEIDAKYAKFVRAAVAYVRRTYPDMLVIYRNTASGHFNCSGYDRPIKKPQRPGLTPRAFSWDEFPRQNEIARSIIEEFGGIYMDVAHMLRFRPDSHRSATDCLHYCQPGPVDWWVDLLYNIFLNLPR